MASAVAAAAAFRIRLSNFNFQDGTEKDLDRAYQRRAQSPGHLHEEEVRPHEEGLRAQRALRLRDLGHHLQLAQQAVPVCFYGHGQSPPQVHR